MLNLKNADVACRYLFPSPVACCCVAVSILGLEGHRILLGDFILARKVPKHRMGEGMLEGGGGWGWGGRGRGIGYASSVWRESEVHRNVAD